VSRKVVSPCTATFHDSGQGAKRGKNTLFSFTIDRVRIVHLEDLGHLLTTDNLNDTYSLPIEGIDGFLTFFDRVERLKTLDITTASLPQVQEIK